MLEGHFGYINPRFSTENSGQTCRLQSQIALVVISAMLPQFSSVQFSCSVTSDSLHPHGLQHARPPCPSPTPRVYSNSCLLSWWCHPSNHLILCCPYLLPPSNFPSFRVFSNESSQFFTSGNQSIGISASVWVLPMNVQEWFSLGRTDWISLQSKGQSRDSHAS